MKTLCCTLNGVAGELLPAPLIRVTRTRGRIGPGCVFAVIGVIHAPTPDGDPVAGTHFSLS